MAKCGEAYCSEVPFEAPVYILCQMLHMDSKRPTLHARTRAIITKIVFSWPTGTEELPLSSNGGDIAEAKGRISQPAAWNALHLLSWK